jgi:PhnB protein
MKTDVNPYLSFNGQCEAAFKFYEKCLGGSGLSFHKYAGSPMSGQVPAEWQDKVMHATLLLGNTALMGADAPPNYFREPQGFSISVSIDQPEDADTVFAALAEGGKIMMPIAKTFWSARFGMLIDKFGIPWMVNSNQQP